ncbi:MAG: hypothetical protein SGILL_003580 [Bacillariaceae sp.]
MDDGSDRYVTKKGVFDAVDALLASKRSRDESSSQSFSSPSSPKKKLKVTGDLKKPATAAAVSTASSERKLQGIENYEALDVLCGRGGGTNLHEGNRFYRDLILSHRTTYDDASKSMKPEIARDIVMRIRERGGRFLRKDKEGLYYDIGDGEAKAKTSQALRHRTFELRNAKQPGRVKMNGRWKQSSGGGSKATSPTTTRASPPVFMQSLKSMPMSMTAPNLQESVSSSASSSSTTINPSLLQEALRRQQLLEASRNSMFPSSGVGGGGVPDSTAYMAALANLRHKESMLSIDRAIHEAERRRLQSLLAPLNQGLYPGGVTAASLSRSLSLGARSPLSTAPLSSSFLPLGGRFPLLNSNATSLSRQLSGSTQEAKTPSSTGAAPADESKET